MHKVRGKLEQQVIGYGQEYPVYRLVDIHRTEIPVVLRNLGSVRRAYPVTPVTYGLVHGNPRLRLAQLIQLRLADVLVNALRYGILPPPGLEEHLENLVFFHNRIFFS